MTLTGEEGSSRYSGAEGSVYSNAWRKASADVCELKLRPLEGCSGGLRWKGRSRLEQKGT